MAFPTVTDRNVQYPTRVGLTEVSAGVYDVAAVPGSVVAEGTAVNAALFALVDTATRIGVQTAAATPKATPVDADSIGYCDSEASNATKSFTWANLKARLKTYFDTLYATGDSAWHEVGAGGEPAFANSWVNYGSTATTAAFRKDSCGFVHLKGTVKSGTINTAIFTLPTGYRPILHPTFGIDSNGAIGVLGIEDSGVVTCSTGNNTYVRLDGLTFYAEV
jgi:hypothetical protein